jgi:hypothetical protein
MMMFKQGSFEDEIFRSMETSLVKTQTEEKHGLSKLAKATDLLNEAASIFDDAEMFQESKDVSDILQNLAKDLK